MGNLLGLLSLPIVKRFVRNTVVTLLAQLQLSADHHLGITHVILASVVGAVTAAFKGLRDTFPNAKWLEFIPF